MLKPQDIVLYGATGVCRVTGVEQRQINGHAVDYYILEPIGPDRSIICVPCASKLLEKKIHPILTAAEAHALIASIADEPPLWNEDEVQRKEEFRSILSSGDRLKIMRMIKALYLQQELRQSRGHRLHACDEQILKAAEKLLYSELALVLHLSQDEILSLIRERTARPSP